MTARRQIRVNSNVPLTQHEYIGNLEEASAELFSD